MFRMVDFSKDDELRERVLLVADYVIANKATTRTASKYFKENHMPISNVTVYNYLTKYLPYIDKNKYQEVLAILTANQPPTVAKEEVRKRVYQAVALLLQGYTIPEIAGVLNFTVDVIYDDVTVRLKRVESDDEVIKQVEEMLAYHRISNLRNQGKVGRGGK